MKVLLIHPNAVTYPKDICMGIIYLSAMLRKHGHETSIIDTTFDMTDEEILEQVKAFDPALIGMTAVSSNFPYATHVAEMIKKNCDAPIAMGGVHATIAPEETIAKDCFDMVCVGEGEHAIVELVESLEAGENRTDIQNFWFKENGKVIENPVRDLCVDIDELPYPDRSIYDFPTYLRHHNHVASFLGSRGCPYQCTYCVNKKFQTLYKGKGRFVRYRSAEKIIEEIKDVIGKYHVEVINFYDDTFTLNKTRVEEFCRLYQKEIDLPFYINARIDNLTEEMCGHLSDAGCQRVSVGVESGDPEIRKKVLGRNVTDEKIISGAKLLKDRGIDIYTYNMIGIPGEKWENIKRTIELNRKIKPDFLAVAVFTAFKGTTLYEECKEQGILDDSVPLNTYYRKSNVRHPYLSSRQLNRIRRWFGFRVFITYDIKRAFIEVFDRNFITNRTYVRIRSFFVSRFVKRKQERKARA